MNANLLIDVLCEGSYKTFREQLQQQIKAEARRKRISRAGAWFALAASGALLFATINRAPAPTQSRPTAITSITQTQNPLLLKTIPLKPHQLLQTRPIQNIVLTTDPFRRAPTISDAELLALFPQKPVGIASTTHGQRKLLFLNPTDRRRFMSSN